MALKYELRQKGFYYVKKKKDLGKPSLFNNYPYLLRIESP
jgi:hypothetical protein